jgi:hypothetical protein
MDGPSAEQTAGFSTDFSAGFSPFLSPESLSFSPSTVLSVPPSEIPPSEIPPFFSLSTDTDPLFIFFVSFFDLPRNNQSTSPFDTPVSYSFPG